MNKFRRIQQFVCLLMRVSLMQIVLATVAVTLGSAAEINGQEALERKISLKVSGSELRNVLTELENQAMVTFNYRTRAIRTFEKVTLEVSETPLRTVLEQLFGDEVVFLVRNNEILLKPKDKRPPAEGQYSELAALEVSGIVYDEAGQSLPGVNVVEKGPRTGLPRIRRGGLFSMSRANAAFLSFLSSGTSPANSPSATRRSSLFPSNQTLRRLRK